MLPESFPNLPDPKTKNKTKKEKKKEFWQLQKFTALEQ